MTSDSQFEQKLAFKNNHWLQLALAALCLLNVWMATGTLWSQHETVRLVIFLLGNIAYFLLTSGFVLRDFYRSRNYRGYFFHQFLILAVTLLAAAGVTSIWFLFLPASSQAVLFLPRKKMTVVLCSHIALSLTQLLFIDSRYFAGYLISFITSFLFMAGCSYSIRREIESRRQLHEAHEKLRAHAEKAEALATAEERNRLAREIHDGVAHHLTAANVLVEAGTALLAPTAPAAATNSLMKAQNQIRAALGELRDSIANRVDATPKIEISQRIHQLIDNGGFPATLNLQGTPRRYSPEIEQAIFRVAQEALTNARKHAPGATIRMNLDFANATRIQLHVENENPPHVASGDGAFGLLSLRERMQRLGGTFHAGPESSGLFVVKAEIPI